MAHRDAALPARAQCIISAEPRREDRMAGTGWKRWKPLSKLRLYFRHIRHLCRTQLHGSKLFSTFCRIDLDSHGNPPRVTVVLDRLSNTVNGVTRGNQKRMSVTDESQFAVSASSEEA
jgi:hypothetical protein